ncbi:MAG: hypothetical protein ACTTIZ_01850 [Treponema sp.]
MMEIIKTMDVAGWISITIIALMIFVVLMMRGIQFGWGDKSVAIGKKFDNKLEAFKKDIELENIKKSQDEILQKQLFKKSLSFDDYLEASLIQSVKKLENSVYKIFKPFLICQYPALCVVDIFEDVLMERVHFNNMKKKLMKENRTAYLYSIVEDIKKNYLLFYEQLQNLHCGEEYPDWGKIEGEVISLVKSWLLQCVDCYIANVKKKIALYRKTSNKFILADIKLNATTLPIKKNKHYLLCLLKAKKEMLDGE